MLLDIADHQLHFEVAGIFLSDLVQAVEDRLQGRQIGYQVNLPVQVFQFLKWIQVLGAHDVILHFCVLRRKRGRLHFFLLGGARGPVPGNSVTIALDATPLTVPTGGVQRYTLELAKALVKHFPDDEYWLLSDQAFPMPEADFPIAGEVPRNMHCGEVPRTFAERRWWLWGVHQEMMQRGVDVFHGTDFAVPYLPLRPSVMTLHDLSPWMDRDWQPTAGRIRNRTRVLLRAGVATMVITPSEAVRRAAIDRFRLAPDRIVAIPLAAAEHLRPVRAPAPAVPYFLFVSTIEPRKNVARLIEAWREVRKAHRVDLVLAGRVRNGFAGPAPEEGLHLRGPVPEADLPALYSGALAVVYPSLYEGFGLPVLEAMQCGALAITSCDPAIMEVASDAAIHVEATDTRALAEAMTAVAAAPKKFTAMRERALDRAKLFSWQRTAERTREVYDAARRIFRR